MQYPCPCCGYLVFSKTPGSHEICPICFWEDDISQLRFPTIAGGANKFSLLDAQKNFESFGASNYDLLSHVRKPEVNEVLDTLWRRINLKKDNIEEPSEDTDYSKNYPKDATQLYYWLDQTGNDVWIPQ
ncbi:MAG: CPCC family cysteine-rich protein [Patescibacteria group bacterium]